MRVPNTPLRYTEWGGPDRGKSSWALVPACIASGCMLIGLVYAIVAGYL